MNQPSVMLAVETSSDACSVALGAGTEVFVRHEVAPREHTRLVLPMVEAVLKDAGLGMSDVDAFVMGRGPGAFTGVRIAVGVVQGLAFSTGRPVLPVSSLAIVAQGAVEAGAGHVAVAFDARMGEVYWGTYLSDSDGVAVAVGQESVIAPEAVPALQDGPWIGAGSGFAAYPEALAQRLGLSRTLPDSLPHAVHALVLGRRAWKEGEAVEAADAQPVYLRDRVVRS